MDLLHTQCRFGSMLCSGFVDCHAPVPVSKPASFFLTCPRCPATMDVAQRKLYGAAGWSSLLCKRCGKCTSARSWLCPCRKAWPSCCVHQPVGFACIGHNSPRGCVSCIGKKSDSDSLGTHTKPVSRRHGERSWLKVSRRRVRRRLRRSPRHLVRAARFVSLSPHVSNISSENARTRPVNSSLADSTTDPLASHEAVEPPPKKLRVDAGTHACSFAQLEQNNKRFQDSCDSPLRSTAAVKRQRANDIVARARYATACSGSHPLPVVKPGSLQESIQRLIA